MGHPQKGWFQKGPGKGCRFYQVSKPEPSKNSVRKKRKKKKYKCMLEYVCVNYFCMEKKGTS